MLTANTNTAAIVAARRLTGLTQATATVETAPAGYTFPVGSYERLSRSEVVCRPTRDLVVWFDL